MSAACRNVNGINVGNQISTRSAICIADGQTSRIQEVDPLLNFRS